MVDMNNGSIEHVFIALENFYVFIKKTWEYVRDAADDVTKMSAH